MPTITNAGSTIIEVPSRAIKIRGAKHSGGYVATEEQENHTLANDMTLSVWCKPTCMVSALDKHMMFAKRANSGTYGWTNWALYIERGTGKFVVWFAYSGNGNAGYDNAKGTAYTFNSNEDWYHVVGVRDTSAGKISLYINGEYENQVNITENQIGSLEDSTDRVVVGALDLNNNACFSGSVSDPRAYSGVSLTANEVKTLYNTGYTPYDNTNLVFSTNFEEITDSAGNWHYFEHNGLANVNVKWVSGSNENGGWFQNPIRTYRDIKCWCTRWDEDNWGMVFETFLDPCDRAFLFNNVKPGAYTELMNILGTPTYLDYTFNSSNTLIFKPQDNFGISSLRQNRMIAVSHISDNFWTHDKFNVKIEGKRLDI